MADLRFIQLGNTEYAKCLELQRLLHARCVSGEIPSHVLLTEHSAVITLGKNSSEKFLIETPKQLAEAGCEVFRTERGGEVTAHMPGQLVVYPIIRLSEFRLTPKKYVELLCEAVIATLGHFGIDSTWDAEYPGVWIGTNKICAVGVRIKDRVGFHGFALNVCNDDSLYSKIVPCGIEGRGITNMSVVLGRTISTADVGEIVAKKMAEKLGHSVVLVDKNYLPSLVASFFLC